MGSDAMILIFLMLSFKPAFPLSSFTFIKRLFHSSLLSAIRVVWSAYLRLLIFSQKSWFQFVLHSAQHLAWSTLHIGDGNTNINTWTNRQIWTWSTEWSRTKANRVLPGNALVIANTLFQQQKRRLYTWTSSDGQHRNQIDYIICSKR